MADVKSKNLYELLGNDHDEDSDKEPETPVKVVDKPVARTTKRNAPDTAPAEPRGGLGGDRGGRGGRRGGFTGSEDAFRDRNTGSTNNRSKPTEDGLRQDRHPDRLGGGARQGNSEGRGGRAGRSGRGGARGGRDDRHSRGFPHDHAKQADQSWGAPTGGSEWDDEKAGEAIAKAEEKAEGFDAAVEPPVDAEGNKLTTTEEAVPLAALITEPEPEDNSKSYADYLAEQAEKKLQLGTGVLEARKPNEGSKQDKKWAQAKPLKKDDEEDAYIAGKGEKAKRERQKKEKNVVDVDLRYVEPQRGGGDRGRGGRGRGEGRGDYRGGDRGRGGRGRGDGYRGRGDGGYRGGRGGRDDHAVNPSDTNAFPSLGGS